MLDCAEFKTNMPKVIQTKLIKTKLKKNSATLMFVCQVIKRIYELSWDMFGDLPRGHHKNNSMHKLASKVKQEL